MTHVKDGDRIEFGDVRLEILETPGHTPEGISILVYDLAESCGPTPRRDDGRHACSLAMSGGRTCWRRSALLPTSWPTCSMTRSTKTAHAARRDAGLSGPRGGIDVRQASQHDTVSTIGEQKKFNYALQPMSREEFKAIVTAEQPEAPGYFVHDAMLNRQEQPSLDATLTRSLRALEVDEVLRLVERGAQLVETRDGIDFEGAHLAGALNIGINGKYATWCGTMLNHDDPIVVIADTGREEEAMVRLGRIGFDNVAGYLKNGMDALEDRPDLVRRIDRITAVALADKARRPTLPPSWLYVRKRNGRAAISPAA